MLRSRDEILLRGKVLKRRHSKGEEETLNGMDKRDWRAEGNPETRGEKMNRSPAEQP